MKPTLLAVVAASFAAGALVGLTASDASARPAPVPAVYTNDVYGFSIVPPAFPKAEKAAGGQAAMFFAPVRSGFATNLNVIVQAAKMSIDEYVELSKGQFEQLKLKAVSEKRLKVSGRDAAMFEYEGKTQGKEMKWMALAVADGDRIVLATGTALAEDYEAVSKEFKASLESFKILD
jgi:hypothetical protein